MKREKKNCVKQGFPLTEAWKKTNHIIADLRLLGSVLFRQTVSSSLWWSVIPRLRVISLLESDVPSLLVLLPCWGCHGIIISLEPRVRLLSAVYASSVWVCLRMWGTEDATNSDEVNFKGPFHASVFLSFGTTGEMRDVTPQEFYQNGF